MKTKARKARKKKRVKKCNNAENDETRIGPAADDLPITLSLIWIADASPGKNRMKRTADSEQDVEINRVKVKTEPNNARLPSPEYNFNHNDKYSLNYNIHPQRQRLMAFNVA